MRLNEETSATGGCFPGGGGTNPPFRPFVHAALGAVALVITSGLHAAGLFLPVDAGGAAAGVAPAAAAAPRRPSAAGVADVWERRVRVAREELAVAREDVESAGAGRLLLNVRDGVRLNVVVERTATTKWGYSLSGRVAGGGGGFVTLVVHEDAVAGSIWTPDAAYELNYVGGGVHALRDVTNAPLECGGALPSELSAEEAITQGGKGDGSLVDILVVWTLEAAEQYGGREPQLSRIDMLIAFANDAFDRSGVFVSLNLVGAEELEYSEADTGNWLSDMNTDFDRLAVPDDGHMDRVHDLRNSLGADLVYLLTHRGGGVAGGGFAVGGASGFTFAHEVGHNFGISHERNEFQFTITREYNHGFTTEGCKTTIMSYGVACYGRGGSVRMPFYASPWRYQPVTGRPLGVARFSKERGARGPADAVLTLSRNRHRVANLRPGRAGQ